MNVLECRDLGVRFRTREGDVEAVRGVSLGIGAGECVGLVGESGSGKSQTCLALMGLLASNGLASGSVELEGEQILNAPRSRLDRLRGNRVGMIFQDPMSSLTPFMRVGAQMCETLVHHRGASYAEARTRVLEALELVRIADARRRFTQYPHELSGGMRQRVMIAQAILCKPALLIADEPTTALDVTVQAQILEILDALKRHAGSSILLVTHDLAVVAEVCDRVAVMYAGRIVEEAPVEQIFHSPRHPYTRALLASILTLDHDPDEPLRAIPGQPPALDARMPGCSFRPRCESATARCESEVPALRSDQGRRVACHLAEAPP